MIPFVSGVEELEVVGRSVVVKQYCWNTEQQFGGRVRVNWTREKVALRSKRRARGDSRSRVQKEGGSPVDSRSQDALSSSSSTVRIHIRDSGAGLTRGLGLGGVNPGYPERVNPC